MPQRIVVGITGASGALYAQRTIRLLLAAGVQTHLVISPLGQRLLHDELGMEGIDLPALAGCGAGDAGGARRECVPGVTLHNYRDVGAPIASGSFAHGGMVIVPCSSNTLSAVAVGSAQNLLHRAAQVCLKERRRLILVHREMPLSLVDIRNMQQATEAGAVICPASPGFYMLPHSVDELVDSVVGRVLDLLGVKHELNVRWPPPPETPETPEPPEAAPGVGTIKPPIDTDEHR
jgi:4-hydroxy-3-polyprenylbenzoate decarboxylase